MKSRITAGLRKMEEIHEAVIGQITKPDADIDEVLKRAVTVVKVQMCT